MELFSIIVMNPSEPYSSTLTQNIFKELQQLHKNKRVFELRYELQGPYTKITGSTTLPEEHKKLIEEQMIEGIAYAIADHIINEHESEIIMELIKKELKLDSQEDIEQVEGYCKQFLNEQEDLIITGIDSATRRRTLIVNQIQLYMQEHTGFNLEGLIRFRLQDYMEELREIVEYAMDEFMMDRQYQEFISLLKYFVYIQEAKIPTAHLIHKGGHEFVILNDELEPINTSEFDSSFKLEVLDKDINFEDMIVSTLITVSPANIYIHTREPEMPVINTIKQIFEARATTCSYCRTCHAHLGELKKQDQLYP